MSMLMDTEAEMAVIGGLLVLSGEGQTGDVMQIAARLPTDAFSEPFLRSVYERITSAASEGRAINAAHLASILPEDQRQDGAQAIAACVARAASRTVLNEQADHLVRLYRLRTLKETLERAAESISPLDTDPDEMTAAVIAEIMTGAHDMAHVAPQSATDVLKNMEAYQTRRKVKTGVSGLDELIDGLSHGAVTTLAARPGMGKSLLAGHIAAHAARNGKAVLMFALEMTAQAVMSRILAGEVARRNLNYSSMHVTARAIMTGQVNPNHPGIEEAMSDIATWPLSIIDRGGMSMDMIKLHVEAWRRRCEKDGVEPALVIIDHIGLAADPPFLRSKYEAMTWKSHEVMAMAKNTGLAVLMVSQLSRGVESRRDRIPTLADLRDTGAIEEDSEVVLFLYNERKELERQAAGTGPEAEEATRKLAEIGHRAQIIVAKNRYGPTGHVTIEMNTGTCFISG